MREIAKDQTDCNGLMCAAQSGREDAADRIEALAADVERLRAVEEAVKDIKARSIDKDNMEFSTTCFAVDRIREALAAVKDASDD